MRNSLRSIGVSRTQLAAVAVVSALASILIITNAVGHSAAQSAAIAALSHRREVLREGGSGGTDPADPDDALPSSYAPAASGRSASNGGSSQSSSSSAGADDAADSDSGDTTTTGSSSPTTEKSPVKHVFVIALSTPSFDAAWGAGSAATYLDKTLKPAGAFLKDYETLGDAELPDYLAMVSGQSPNRDTEAGCATYSDFPSSASPDASGQVPGDGCVYPDTIITVADQVTASGHTWKGYIEDLAPSNCVAPNSGALDDTQLSGAGPEYMTRHNPFIYFGSLVDLGDCSADDVSLTKLPNALHSVGSTPSYSFIAPGTCEDGTATSCPGGGASGIAAEDAFLRQWVPEIEHSAAYKADGVIVIVFAHSATSGGTTPVRTGALVLSRFATKGKTISTRYNPYSILRGTEDLLGFTLLDHAKNAVSFVGGALPGA